MKEKMHDPNDAIDYIIRTSAEFAQAKANRVYMEELRKTYKAELCKEALANGFEAVNAQEREAYSHPRYKAHLEAIKQAVEAEEQIRWMLIAAEARIDVWRSLEASKRSEIKMAL
jgi:hypothetical protein